MWQFVNDKKMSKMCQVCQVFVGVKNLSPGIISRVKFLFYTSRLKTQKCVTFVTF